MTGRFAANDSSLLMPSRFCFCGLSSACWSSASGLASTQVVTLNPVSVGDQPTARRTGTTVRGGRLRGGWYWSNMATC